jgi:hypothetical protein
MAAASPTSTKREVPLTQPPRALTAKIACAGVTSAFLDDISKEEIRILLEIERNAT